MLLTCHEIIRWNDQGMLLKCDEIIRWNDLLI